MKTLVLGASGATSRLLVNHLVSKGMEVTAIVRDRAAFEAMLSKDTGVHVVEGQILEMPDDEIQRYVDENDAFISCLGHTLSFKGVFGEPRRLVTDSIKRIVQAQGQSKLNKTKRLVLMNTIGCCNHDEKERRPLSQRMVVFLLSTSSPHMQIMKLRQTF